MSTAKQEDGARKAPEAVAFDFAPSSFEEWKEAAGAALAARGAEPVRGEAFDKRMNTRTYEGITLRPMYTIEDTKDLRAARTFPGAYSLRGNSASGNLGRPWEIAQFGDEASPAESNKAMKHELERGASAVAFRVGRELSQGDVEALLGGLLDKPLHIYAGESAASLLKSIEALAGKEKVSLDKLTGCVGADPLGALLETGGVSRSMEELWDDMAESIRWAQKAGAPLRTVLARAGAVAHNGGASAVQEVACAMTAAIEALRAMLARGISVGDLAQRLRFEFSQGANFFMEIAKIRAARQVWARIAESFGGDEAAQRSNIFARTSSFTKTIYDPYVNMLRNTTEAFSAVVGGVEGLTVVPFDEPFKAPSEFSRRVSRNAQIMLQKEFNLLEPIDPAGGSWYIERLTDELAHKIWAELQKIEGQGGFLKSVQDGLIQKDVEGTLQERFKNLAKRSDRAVGSNMYPNTLEHVEWKDVPKAAPNAPIKPAVTVAPIARHRWTEQFEEMRRRTEDYKAKTGDNVKVFLANMGPIPQHKARADFISSFMEVADFEVLRNDGFKTTDDCAKAAIDSGAPIAVICSTDATYPELVPPLAQAIKAKKPDVRVYLAGEPAADHKEAYEKAGVDGFISVRSNCLETLTGFQKMKGMC